MAIMCDKAFDKSYFFIMTVDLMSTMFVVLFFCVLICTPTTVIPSEGL